MPWAFTAIAAVLALSAPTGAYTDMPGLHRVAYDDCGVSERQPHLVTGGMYRYPESEVPVSTLSAEDPARTVAHGEQVVFRYAGLAPSGIYQVRVQYLSDCDTRVQRVQAGDAVLKERLVLPRGVVVSETMDLPRDSYASGELTLTFAKLEGPNAVVSTIELWSSASALPPILQVTINSLHGNSLTGRVLDANTVCGVEGAKIGVALSGRTHVGRAVSKEDGSFTCTLPPRPRTNAGTTLTCLAAKAGLTAKLQLPLNEITMEAARLTPPPMRVEGVATNKVSLDGTWQFHPAPPKEFWMKQAGAGDGWSPIEVPGEWAMQGFNVEKNVAAAYRREFVVPDEWQGRRIKVRFDAVSSRTTVWVNGTVVGEHEGGFTPFEFDITESARCGASNTVALSVENDTLADELASATQYAAHPLGGITRKAYVFCTPEANVASLRADTVFDTAYENATLKVGLEIANDGVRRAKALGAHFALCDPDGKEVALAVRDVAFPAIEAGETFKGSVEIPVTRPAKWDNEHPRLYTLSCTLQRDGHETETLVKRIGFRQVEVRKNQLFVNGSPVKLRGSCRHETHPLRGRSLTPELWRKDTELFRDANVNYIRTSHYPPAEEFIEACDELGLLVEEEAPICWVGHAAGSGSRQSTASNAQIEALILRQTEEMIRRDASHPSVVIWSLANESKWGPFFEHSLTRANEADATRPKSFHDQAWGTFNNFGSVMTDIAVYHYPTPAEAAKPDVRGRPMLFGEYSHLNAYNREELVTDPGIRDAWGRGFAGMWEKIAAAQDCLGGALWAGIDDVFELPSGHAVGYGPWGFIDGWRRQKPEYWHVKKVYSPIRLEETPIAVPPPGARLAVRVTNRSDFANLREMSIAWTLQDGTAALASGTISAVNVAPHADGMLSMALPETKVSPTSIKIDFHSPRGFLVDTFAIPFVRAAKPEAPTAATTTIDFDRHTGEISVNEAGYAVLVGGPRLMVLPLKSGVCATTFAADIQPFNDTCHNWTVDKIDRGHGAVIVKGHYDEAEGTFTTRLLGAGECTLEYRFTLTSDVDPRQIGVVFDLPRAFDTLSWQRKGQWSVYPDDHIGRNAGTAHAFAGPAFVAVDRRTPPQPVWALDATAMGSNDFRSTKENVSRASLTTNDGRSVTLHPEHGGVRTWVEGDRVRLLVFGYSNAGGEAFFSSQSASERRPLKKGDIVEGNVRIQFGAK